MMDYYNSGPMDEHFPPTEDRFSRRHFSRQSGGRLSPTHSAHGSLIRSSIIRISEEKRAKKVRFYRNGDRFFKGMIYAVSPERFRTFESLLAELTSSPLCDKNVLPSGVRHVFSIDGSKKITSLDQLEEGENYVCASTDAFRRVDYSKCWTPNWNPNVRSPAAGQAHETSSACNTPAPPGRPEMQEDFKNYIRPKLVTIIRNGTKPRKAVRILLNKKTAHSFEQVLNDVTEAIKLDTGAVRKIFTLDGRQVTNLSDLFKDDSVFLAYGPERYSMDDFDLDDNEVKFVSAYRSVRQKERVTLRSPRTPRRSLSSSSGKVNEAGLRYTLRSSPAGSPVMQRKVKPPVPAKPAKPNGINGGQNGIPEDLLEKYRIGNIIGEGNFAVVKECTEKYNKREFALKIISKNKVKAKKQMIESEVSILRIVKHPNIIQLIEEYNTAGELYLVMELVRGGDLFDAISSATKYTERDASGMMYNLASALKYLHSLNVVHRDIKLENLLVFDHEDGSKSLKLGDFGLATFVKGKQYTVCGTPTYVAPEILAETGYGLKIDMWSSGIITYILLCGFPPFVSQSNDQDELFDRIMEGSFDFPSPYWDDVSESAQDLIEGLLQVDPGTRMSATQMLEHPWVADDTALDNDMHTSVARKLSMHFEKRQSKFPELSPGVKLVAMTALDKGSRFFEGRGHSPVRQLQPMVKQNGYDDYDDDEIF